MGKRIFTKEQSLLGNRVSDRLKKALDDLETQETLVQNMQNSETPQPIKQPPYK